MGDHMSRPNMCTFGACIVIHSPSKSSSSSQPPLRLLTTMLPPSFSLVFSASEPRSSFSCSSVTLLLSCPDFASMINLFSTSVARDSLTRRIRPRRSAASGSSIWDRMAARASAAEYQSQDVIRYWGREAYNPVSYTHVISLPQAVRLIRWTHCRWSSCLPEDEPPPAPPCCWSCARRARRICGGQCCR